MNGLLELGVGGGSPGNAVEDDLTWVGAGGGYEDESVVGGGVLFVASDALEDLVEGERLEVLREVGESVDHLMEMGFELGYAGGGGVVDAPLALEGEGAEDAEADGDSVGDGVVGCAFDRVAEGVAEVEEEAFLFVELVDLDEPLFCEQAVEDELLEGFGGHGGGGSAG